ncbi:RHS repeat-associated core domain-containing protein [Candidatus Nitrospira bockiana]
MHTRMGAVVSAVIVALFVPLGASAQSSGQVGVLNGLAVQKNYAVPPGDSTSYSIGGRSGLNNLTLAPDYGYDAVAFFMRTRDGASTIPLGWQGLGLVYYACANGDIWWQGGAYYIVQSGGTWYWSNNPPPGTGGGSTCITPAGTYTWYPAWDQAAHPVGGQNPLTWQDPVPSVAPSNGNPNPSDGDPVDLATGLFVLDKTDLVVPDILPITLTRTYRPGDTFPRPFGLGSTHPYHLWLLEDGVCQTISLILPNGARIPYVRTSGTNCNDAVLEHTSSPTHYYKSRLIYNNVTRGWQIMFKDGMIYRFQQYGLTAGAAGALLIEIEDRNGNRMLLSRDQNGRLTKVTSPNGRYINFTYDTSNRVSQVTDIAGRVVSYTYDASGRLWKVTDPENGITEYGYDGAHRMTTIKDARGITFLTNIYDTNDRVITQTQADNTTYQFTYTLDGNGKVTQTDVTDPRGYVRRVTFNAAGYTVTDTRALGQPEQQGTTYAWQTGTNLLLSVTDALNRQTAYTYDAAGNVTSVTRMAGTSEAATATYTYEPLFNQLGSVTDPLSHTTAFTYDLKGNLITITDPLNKQTTITVNTAGQPTAITNPLNQTSTLAYASGDLAGVTDPLSRSTTRLTDAVGRLLSLKTAMGNLTRYSVDSLNRVTQITDAINGATSFTYDANGNLLTVTDAKNQTTTYTYNNMDRLATREDPLTKIESYGYDNNGNLTTVTDRKSQVTAYTYDALNRRKTATYQDGSTTTYAYDAGNRLTQVVDSLSGTITRTYDNFDRLTQEVTPEGTVSYAYDAAGRRTSMTVAGQTAVNYTYDNANRLTQVTQGTSTVTIAYDDAGRRTSLTLPTGTSITYTYDVASQLTGLTYQQGQTTLGTLTYTYDSDGNRKIESGTWAATDIPQASGTTSYNANNQMLTFGPSTLTYDLNGNMTTATDSFGTATYTWNAHNQLAAVSAPGVIASFGYDGLGRRRNKTINSTVTRFLYDGLNPVQELSGSAVTANLLTGLGIDEFFTRTDSAGTRGLVGDALGSTRALVDNVGTVQTNYAYEPFGNTTTGGTASTNSFQYTGRENDETGLYYYRTRYYSPRLQRFAGEDPIEFEGGSINLYAYVLNSPTNYNDPEGLIVPQLLGCSLGVGVTYGLEKLSGRKPTLLDLGLGCLGGVLGGFPIGKGFKIEIHDPHHYFPLFGKNLPHIQITWWQKGVPGSGRNIRIPIPQIFIKR